MNAIDHQLDDAGLSIRAFRIYFHLIRRAGKNGKAFPSVIGMAKTCVMTRKSVFLAITELEGSGLISVIREIGRSNHYEVIPTNRVNQSPEGTSSENDTSVELATTTSVELATTTSVENDTLSYSKEAIQNKALPVEREIQKPKRDKKENSQPSETGLKFADWFKTLIPDRNFETTWRESWATTYDEMIRIDKRTKTEIFNVCKWATSDPFWSQQVLSPKKLRERKDGIQYFDKLKCKMNPIINNQFIKKTEHIPGVGQMTQEQMATCRKRTTDAQTEYLKKYDLI